MTPGASIAAEVRGGLAEAGAQTGTGEPLLATLTSAGAGSDAYGTDPEAPGEARTAVAVMLEYSAREIDGTVIQATDRKALLEAMDPAPTTGDTLTVEGRTYTVQRVATLAPGGVAISHELQVRG